MSQKAFTYVEKTRLVSFIVNPPPGKEDDITAEFGHLTKEQREAEALRIATWIALLEEYIDDIKAKVVPCERKLTRIK